MSVLLHPEIPTMDAVTGPFDVSYERGIETEVLLRAVAALHREGILTDAEYESKRQRLAPQP